MATRRNQSTTPAGVPPEMDPFPSVEPGSKPEEPAADVESAEAGDKPAADVESEHPVESVPKAEPGKTISHEEAMAKYRAELKRRRDSGEVEDIDLGMPGPQRHRRIMEMILQELHSVQRALQAGSDPSQFVARAIGIASKN